MINPPISTVFDTEAPTLDRYRAALDRISQAAAYGERHAKTDVVVSPKDLRLLQHLIQTHITPLRPLQTAQQVG